MPGLLRAHAAVNDVLGKVGRLGSQTWEVCVGLSGPGLHTLGAAYR
jgi:hypothetical protein